jgi:hypothetical protein
MLGQAEVRDGLRDVAATRAAELEEAHARLRRYTGGGRLRVEAYDPDLLGVYVFVPGGVG